VPIAVSALGGTAIERSGITNVLDIAQRTPSVTMTQFNVGEPQTYIRGVGSQTDSPASEPSVLISQDEVPIGRGGASSVTFLDVDRVEVLRGPQGTLYGRNASAGAISFYARRPQDQFGGSIEGSYGRFDTKGVKGILNVPLADGITARGAMQWSSSDGHAHNIRTGEDLQGGKRWAGRLQLQGKFDRLTMLLSGDFAKDDLTGDSRFDVGGPYSNQAILALINRLQAGYHNVWDSSGFSGTFQDRRNWGLTGRIDYEADFATIPFARIFELTLGGRLTHDRKSVFQQAIHNGPPG